MEKNKRRNFIIIIGLLVGVIGFLSVKAFGLDYNNPSDFVMILAVQIGVGIAVGALSRLFTRPK